MNTYGKGCDGCGWPELEHDAEKNTVFCFNCGWEDSSVDYNALRKQAIDNHQLVLRMKELRNEL